MSNDVAGKWGRSVAERGFTQLPNYLLLLNQFLEKERRLSPVELVVLFQLAGAWWRKDAMPFPSMITLAKRCGVSERQVQRAVNQLVGMGLMGRVKRRTKGIIASNAYDLAPLAAFLGEVAKAFPNGYPRKLDVGAIKSLSAMLGTGNTVEHAEDDADLEDVEPATTEESNKADEVAHII